MDWNDVRYFLVLARLGSVRAAGKALGVSHSTVARRVEALEAELGSRLFDRSADGYTLTAAGRQLLPGAEAVEREVASAARAVLGQDDRLAGTVAVTCGDPAVAAVVLAGLADLCRAHPAIELQFTVDGRPFDLARREADVAVRALPVGVSPPELLLGARVGPVKLASYVAVAHAHRLDPARPGSEARWLGYDDPKMITQLVATSSHPSVPLWGSFSTLEAIRSAAHAGLGLVMLPVYIGDADPQLRRLDRPDVRHLGDLWLLCHPDLRHTARVQAVRAAVAQAFRDQAARFHGEARPVSAPPRPENRPGRGHDRDIP